MRSKRRESGTARLEEAVAAFRAALEERTRERVPLDWAMTQNNLGLGRRMDLVDRAREHHHGEKGRQAPAVIAMKDVKWGERPLALVMLEPDHVGKIAEDDIRLHVASFVERGLGEVWSTPDAKAFREAAIGVIAMEPGLGGWIETRDLYARQAALARNIPVAVADPQFPQPPSTLVDRALWTKSQPIEARTYDSLDICRDLFGLVRLLLADADAEANSPAPHSVAAQIVDLAIDRAELFIDLLFHGVFALQAAGVDVEWPLQTAAVEVPVGRTPRLQG